MPPRTILDADSPDRDLIVAVREGDLEALDLLFARHHRRLYRFLARLTGDHDAADDLVQEVFLRLLRYRESYRDGSEFLPWLFRIARNLAATHYRALEATTSLDDDAVALPTDDTDALEQIITAEGYEQLDRTLAALPAPHRELLLLRGVEGLSHRDIATTLGCSEAAARVRVHRALSALRREWYATAGESR